MARITRCSNCFNPVFEDAATCPHCNVGRTPRTRPRLLTGRSWAFIVVVLVIFGLVDGLILVKHRKNQARIDFRTELASVFFREHLGSSDVPFEDLHIAVDEDRVDLTLVRNALPADHVYIESFRRIGTGPIRDARGRLRRGRRARVQKYRFRVVVNRTGLYTRLKGYCEVIQRDDYTAIYKLRIRSVDDLGSDFDPNPRFGTPLRLQPREGMPVPVSPRRRRDG